MGTVTNLTTTGNYEAVSGSLKTTFSFAVDHGTGKLKNINGGNVTENVMSLSLLLTSIP